MAIQASSRNKGFINHFALVAVLAVLILATVIFVASYRRGHVVNFTQTTMQTQKAKEGVTASVDSAGKVNIHISYSPSKHATGEVSFAQDAVRIEGKKISVTGSAQSTDALSRPNVRATSLTLSDKLNPGTYTVNVKIHKRGGMSLKYTSNTDIKYSTQISIR